MSAPVASAPGGEERASLTTWLALFGCMLGALMAVLNIQITNASLTDIEGGIGTGVDNGAWISTAYLIGEIIVIPLTDYLSRVFSFRRFLIVNAALFLCFSAAWRFETPPPTFSALSLVVGLALVKSLQAAGIGDARLKWPNDIVRGAGKLAGILIEMRAEAGGPCCAVIGVGLNIALSPAARARIDRPSDDVVAAGGAEVARNRLAARLLADLARVLGRFAERGFAPFRADWLAQDALAGRMVTLDLGHRVVTGRASGVDDYGALLIEQNGTCERFLSGHLTAV